MGDMCSSIGFRPKSYECEEEKILEDKRFLFYSEVHVIQLFYAINSVETVYLFKEHVVKQWCTLLWPTMGCERTGAM